MIGEPGKEGLFYSFLFSCGVCRSGFLPPGYGYQTASTESEYRQEVLACVDADVVIAPLLYAVACEFYKEA
jgi:hypothetical protein